MADLLQGPIPGQSLTEEPRNAPWERPSEMNTVEEAVRHYVGVLADQDVLDDVAVAFELGADLQTLTKTLVGVGAMKGLHTVETGMLAGPVVASFIKVAMDSYGIETPEKPISMKDALTAKEKSRMDKLLDQAVQSAYSDGADETDPGVAFLKDMVDPEATLEDSSMEEVPMDETTPVEEPEMPVPEKGMGLMSREGAV